jgi:hypothetical protein
MHLQVKLDHEIKGKKDISLPGVRVLTWGGYVDILKSRHNITAAGHAWCAAATFGWCMSAICATRAWCAQQAAARSRHSLGYGCVRTNRRLPIATPPLRSSPRSPDKTCVQYTATGL